MEKLQHQMVGHDISLGREFDPDQPVFINGHFRTDANFLGELVFAQFLVNGPAFLVVVVDNDRIPANDRHVQHDAA